MIKEILVKRSEEIFFDKKIGSKGMGKAYVKMLSEQDWLNFLCVALSQIKTRSVFICHRYTDSVVCAFPI
jgi:hypothetical protein